MILLITYAWPLKLLPSFLTRT